MPSSLMISGLKIFTVKLNSSSPMNSNESLKIQPVTLRHAGPLCQTSDGKLWSYFEYAAAFEHEVGLEKAKLLKQYDLAPLLYNGNYVEMEQLTAWLKANSELVSRLISSPLE